MLFPALVENGRADLALLNGRFLTGVHCLHENLFPGFSIALRENGQNKTIIFAKSSIPLCEGASILSPDQAHTSRLTGKRGLSARREKR